MSEINDVDNIRRSAKLGVLKTLVGLPVPKNEEWSSDYRAGVEHGYKLYEQKLKFEIQRLKKLIKQQSIR